MARSKAKKRSSTIVSREAKLLKERSLDLSLVEVFAGEREGSPQERERLNSIASKLKNRIYSEAVYLLTHTDIKQPDEAKKTFEDIISHRNAMVRMLKRSVSMQVAALDYMQNVRNILKKPTIIEADQYEQFAYKAILDETTHAFEKELLDSDIDSEIEKSRRFDTAFSVLFLDLDDLKSINDTHGHETGTRAIQILSSCARENLRKYDSIYRYGGDEFVVLLPGADANQAHNTAQRIIELIHSSSIEKLPEPLGVSIGVAEFNNEDIRDRNSLISAADNALYTAKKAGKNRICIYGDTAASRSKIERPEAQTPKPAIDRNVLQGMALVPGWCIGKAIHYHDILSREIEVREVKQHEVGAEMQRMLRAVERVKTDLEHLKTTFEHNVDSRHAAIFDVHKTILDDTDLLSRLESELKSRMTNSEHVVRNVFRKLEHQFRTAGSTVLSERAFDIRDIGSRLLRVLTGAEDSILSHISGDAVIFAKRLLPSDTIHFTQKKPLAVVTEEGGRSCHSALIARALGIPSVSNIHYDSRIIPNGTEVVVDGDSGKVTIAPSQKEIARARAKIRGQKRSKTIALKKLKNRDYNNAARSVKVMANAGSEGDVRAAVDFGCDGIGLYRTEAIYMLARELPGEEAVLRSLQKSLEGFNNGPVVLRLADLGGDKILPYLNVGREHSSYLGMRGVRFLLNFPDFLQTQLRVFIRLAARHQVRILVPFVSNAGDMQRVREALRKTQASLRKEKLDLSKSVDIGAMIETPLACLRIGEILKHADFISIGTNDLIQYLSAADRESLAVSGYFEDGTEPSLTFVSNIIGECKKAGKDCSLCGELAADSRHIKRLLDEGLENFSVLPPLIPSTRKSILKMQENTIKRKETTSQKA